MAARTKKQPAASQPASPPVRAEVRINGRLRYSDVCYDPTFEVEGNTVRFTATLDPTMVTVPTPPPRLSATSDDPRDGEEIITRVHSGRRDK